MRAPNRRCTLTNNDDRGDTVRRGADVSGERHRESIARNLPTTQRFASVEGERGQPVDPQLQARRAQVVG